MGLFRIPFVKSQKMREPQIWGSATNVKAAGPAHEVRDERNETGRVAPHGRAYFSQAMPTHLK